MSILLRRDLDGRLNEAMMRATPAAGRGGQVHGESGGTAPLEEELRHERDFARALVETARVIILVLDNDARIVSFNPNWESLSGYALEEVRGRDWIATFVPERERAAVRRVVAAALSGAATQGYVNPIVTRAGVELQVQWYDMTRQDAGGRAIGVLAVGHDVTDLVAVGEKLRKSEQRSRQLVELAQEGIWAIDAEGRTTFANPKMAEMLGCSVEDLAGSSLFDYMDEEGKAITVPHMDRWRQGSRDRHDVEFIRRDGARIYTTLSIAPIADEQGRYAGVLVGVADVTEHRRLQERFITAQKMEMVGRLAGRVAHRFTNLLTVVSGCATRVERALHPLDPARRDVEQVIAASARLTVLTQKLLAFSGRQTIRVEPLDVNGLVLELGPVLDALANGHVERENVLAPGLGEVKADRGQIQQVLMNLVTNALDTMPAGGRLTIETSNVVLDGPHLDVAPGDYVMLAVSGTGIGLAADVQDPLLKPLFSTKATGHGDGLGLVAAYGSVKQHGGDIRVRSMPGQGARFAMYLPRWRSRANGGPRASQVSRWAG